MPELPEVETIRRSLQPETTGKRISELEILTPGVFLSANGSPIGSQIEGIERCGKYLLIMLNQDKHTACLIVHLRMTGRLLLRTSKDAPVKHTHLRFRLDPASPGDAEPVWLDFVDPRRFGRIWFTNKSFGNGPAGLARLGPEPLGPQFSSEHLKSALAGRKRSLKALLLDQEIIAGLGNIYADESLFAAGLHPASQGGSLQDQEIVNLVRSIREVLEHAIDCNGTTLRDYADGWNRKGSFQDCLMVYGRSGQPCRDCGETILHCRLAGRTTCWCPKCQPDRTIGSEASTV